MTQELQVDPNAPMATMAQEAPRLQPEWQHEPDLQTLKGDIELARPQTNNHIAKVNEWLDHLRITGRAKITPRKGRSGVQPQIIRKHAEWRYSSLSEPFLSSSKVFSCNPRTWEDKDAAEQGELLLNYQFDTCLNKVTLVDQYVRTAVDEGTVVLHVCWERETRKTKIMAPVYQYNPVTDEQQGAALQEAIQLAIDNPNGFAQLKPDIQESVKYSNEKNSLFVASQIGEQEVDHEQVIKNQPMVEIASIFNLVVDPTCGADYSKALFMAYSREMTKAELERDPRYKNLEFVHWESAGPLTEPDHESKGPVDFNFNSGGRQKIVVNEYWGVYDVHGTGNLTPFVMAWIGNTVIRLEENPYPDGRPPFVIVPLLPLRKSVYGESDGSLLIDNQKIIGAITRGIIDLMARSANAQRGTAKGMLDPVNRRKFDSGEDYEFNPNVHPSMGIMEHKFPEVPITAMNMIVAQAAEAESLTGVKTFGDQGLSGGSLGPTAAGVRGVLDASSRREMGILRRLAKGMAEVGQKISAMNQEWLSESEVVRITNAKFVQVKREDIKGNYDLIVDISTAEEDEAKASRLEFMLQTLGPNAGPDMVKLVLAEIARLRRMPGLKHQIETFKPAPDPIADKIKELEVRKLEAEVMELEAQAMERKAAATLKMAQAQKAMAEAELATSVKDKVDLDFVEQETGTAHARDVDKMAAQARGNIERDITNGIMHQRNGASVDGKVDDTPREQDIAQAISYNQR